MTKEQVIELIEQTKEKRIKFLTQQMKDKHNTYGKYLYESAINECDFTLNNLILELNLNKID